MPFDHFRISVSQANFEPLISFLTQSLGHIGFKDLMRPFPGLVGMGESLPYLWIGTVTSDEMDESTLKALHKRTHFAFSCASAEQVRQFHSAALQAGGTCNGPPGIRPHYHPGYYAAFVLDPVCGINLELISHNGE